MKLPVRHATREQLARGISILDQKHEQDSLENFTEADGEKKE